MKILHSYCLNYNIGDYALGIGLKNILRSFLKVDLIGNTNIQGRVFDEYYINEVVNKRYDLLVIGGGGLIHGSHWPNGWFWLIDKSLIKTIKIPFIVYGVGNNYFTDEIIPDRAAAHLQETYKYANFFSVRNDGSQKRLLEQTGINAEVVPDPGFHVGINSEYDKPEKNKYVIIQLANDKPEDRYKDNQQRQKFINSIKKVVKTLSLKYKIIFAPHVYDDIELCKEVMKDVPNCVMWDFGYFAFDHVDKAVSYYKYAEFVLAMRGHAQILPIAFNTPVISMQNHPKHIGLMRELGLSEYNVDIQDDKFESILQDKIKKVEYNKSDLFMSYEEINVTLHKNTEVALSKIRKLIGY